MKKTMSFPKGKGRSAFTLIEIVVVITIIIVLIGLLSPALRTVREQAKKQEAKAIVGALEVATTMHYTDTGNYPAAANWASIMAEGDGAFGPYMDQKHYNGTSFLDPWGSAYQYSAPGTHTTPVQEFDIWSDGSGENIGSW